METIIQRMDKQQNPTAEHKELYSVTCDKIKQKNMQEDVYIYLHMRIYISTYAYICLTEPLSCSAEIKHNTVDQLYLNNKQFKEAASNVLAQLWVLLLLSRFSRV